MGYAGFAGIASFDAADAEEFLAAAFEVGFDGFNVGGGHDEDHADAHVERLQQFVSFDFSEHCEKFEDGWNGPGGEIDLRFYTRGRTRGKLPGIPPPVMCASAETQPRAMIFLSAGA